MGARGDKRRFSHQDRVLSTGGEEVDRQAGRWVSRG